MSVIEYMSVQHKTNVFLKDNPIFFSNIYDNCNHLLSKNNKKHFLSFLIVILKNFLGKSIFLFFAC